MSQVQDWIKRKAELTPQSYRAEFVDDDITLVFEWPTDWPSTVEREQAVREWAEAMTSPSLPPHILERCPTIRAIPVDVLKDASFLSMTCTQEIDALDFLDLALKAGPVFHRLKSVVIAQMVQTAVSAKVKAVDDELKNSDAPTVGESSNCEPA